MNDYESFSKIHSDVDDDQSECTFAQLKQRQLKQSLSAIAQHKMAFLIKNECNNIFHSLSFLHLSSNLPKAKCLTDQVACSKSRPLDKVKQFDHWPTNTSAEVHTLNHFLSLVIMLSLT